MASGNINLGLMFLVVVIALASFTSTTAVSIKVDTGAFGKELLRLELGLPLPAVSTPSQPILGPSTTQAPPPKGVLNVVRLVVDDGDRFELIG